MASDLLTGTEPVSRPSRVRVLVVDDEADAVFLMRAIFEMAGYDVVSAANGAEALARVGDEAIDVVVTDLMMPVMGGRELINRLRSDDRTKNVPVVVVSASASAAIAEAGADITIQKPFQADKLLGALRSLVGGPPWSV